MFSPAFGHRGSFSFLFFAKLDTMTSFMNMLQHMQYTVDSVSILYPLLCCTQTAGSAAAIGSASLSSRCNRKVPLLQPPPHVGCCGVLATLCASNEATTPSHPRPRTMHTQDGGRETRRGSGCASQHPQPADALLPFATAATSATLLASGTRSSTSDCV